MTQPPYTPTDYGVVIASLLTAGLNLAAMFGVVHLDAVTRSLVVNALSGILGVLVASFVGHRAVKHAAATIAGHVRP